MRRYVDHADRKIPEILTEIDAYAGHYRVFQREPPEGDARVAAAHDRIRVLGASTALPLLLWLRHQRDEDRLSADRYRQAVLDVESYLVRRVAIGANTRGYNSTFRELLSRAQDAADAGEDVAAALRVALDGLQGSAGWPSDVDVEAAFIDRRLYNNVAQYVIKLLLSGIEERLRTQTPHLESIDVDYESLTIEHIMPQQWRSHWPLEGEGADLTLAEQRRDGHLHRIGNLTLLTGSLNTSQSNKPWSEKRAELARFSTLRLNAELVQHDRWQVWDERAISARASELAELACGEWARPAPQEEAPADARP